MVQSDMELSIYNEIIRYSDSSAAITKAGVNSLKDDSGELLARVCDGDERAFGEMFERYHQFILRFVCGMVGGEQELAEELTQETFMGAYRSRHLLRGDARLSTWLCAIAKNVVSKSFRARRLREHLRVEVDEQSLSGLKETSPLPDRQLLNEELNQVVNRAVLRLNEDWRAVFILKVFQQLSYEEISEITGFSIPKLKTDLHRAKAEVRRLVRPYLEVRNEV